MANQTPEKDRNAASDEDTKRAMEIVEPIVKADAAAEGALVLGLAQKGKRTVEKGKTKLEFVGIGDIPPIMTPKQTKHGFELAEVVTRVGKKDKSLPEEEFRDPEEEEAIADARKVWEAQQLAAATPEVGSRGPGIGAGGISGPVKIARMRETRPEELAQKDTGTAGPTETEASRAETAMAPKRAPDSDRWSTETFLAINVRKEELDESAWLKKAIENSKYGAEFAWKEFQRAYVNRFPKGSRPTGADIHKFQADWCRKELGIDLYADAAKAKAEAGARTLVEVTKPLKRDLKNPQVRTMFGGIRYELAQKVGVDSQHITPEVTMALYGILTEKDLPENWGKIGDQLVFDPGSGSNSEGSLAFVVKTDGEYKVLAQKTLDKKTLASVLKLQEVLA